MRIAIDCRSIFPGAGGIGHHAAALVRALARVDGGHEYLLLFGSRAPEVPIVRDDRFRCVMCETGMIDEQWEQVQLPAVLADRGVDLYHSPCFALPVVQTTSRRISTVHDVVFRARPDLVEAGLGGYLDRWTEHAVDVADAVITVSEFSRNEILAAYGPPPEKVQVIYNGVESRFHRPRSGRTKRDLAGRLGLGGRIVLYVGSLEPKKNIDRLLAAFAQLARGGTDDATLVLAGGRGGKSYAADAAIDRLGLRDRTHLTGYLDDADIVTLMQMADLFVYPSLYEGFGLPPLEAMACGTPVVVSDATCLPEIVGGAALVASAEDVDEIAAAMRRGLADRNLRRALTLAGRRRAREFTWERTARQTLAVYESVAEDVQ